MEIIITLSDQSFLNTPTTWSTPEILSTYSKMLMFLIWCSKCVANVLIWWNVWKSGTDCIRFLRNKIIFKPSSDNADYIIIVHGTIYNSETLKDDMLYAGSVPWNYWWWYQCLISRFNISHYIDHISHLLCVNLKGYIDGLVQDCSNSIANALAELLQSCTKPLILSFLADWYGLSIYGLHGSFTGIGSHTIAPVSVK